VRQQDDRGHLESAGDANSLSPWTLAGISSSSSTAAPALSSVPATRCAAMSAVCCRLGCIAAIAAIGIQ